MATKLQRRTASLRKLHLLQTLNKPKSVKRSCSIINILLHFYKLKVKLEEIQREYQNLLKNIRIPKLKQEVKVEKISGEQFVVRVACNKGGDKLVSILEVFDELGLNVVQARVSCRHFFSMEAIIGVGQDQKTSDMKDITDAVLKAIDEKQSGEQEMLVT
ncbi:hypothetical protein ERO13_D10G035700v2 [Gossypium hirsutum]|uniref:Uncharacterized protein isoform X1 n=4 Tax=Gossypium TaxID=3633 RepID=A0A1U8JL07_GOSHI|nr:uncharacterized protein LOC107908255 isoform X1 [Gossypium hirsutum]KAB1670376.1 hypothetical protein ES319_1Z172400v1 [Gossypium barbadense]KAG4124363.1 hypothetical protein ERO13_D10G035700v2 [Gossypium hirsutum]TYG48738.1 hypothetical protein ES288_D10G039800v1 [Gossypium darwinii]TYH48042.1 hypothetical protein ES332_D10G040700v1 [Gossypium tomentosum]